MKVPEEYAIIYTSNRFAWQNRIIFGGIMIYFLEDDENIRKLVSYALSREGYEVRDFSCPREFWKALEIEIPDLILLDIMLPEEDGLTILSRLRKGGATSSLPIMMLTAKGSEFDKVAGLDLGADDYLAKPFGMTELISRIRALLRRAGGMKTSEYRIGALLVNPGKHVVRVDGEEVSLSYKEYSLLLALLEAHGNVVARNTLLNQVWGEFYEESRTLDVHIRKLRQKLGAAGGLIQTVKNVGYKIEVE